MVRCRSVRMKRTALAAALVLSPSLSLAQAPATRADGGPWRPVAAVDGDAVPWAESTLVPGHGRWNVGLLTEFVRDPLVAVDASGTRRSLLRDQLWATLAVQVGRGSRSGLALQVPMLLFQEGESVPGAPAPPSTALGDVRLSYRWSTRAELDGAPSRETPAQAAQHARERREGFGFALQAAASVPLSGGASYAGLGAPAAHVSVVADYRLSRLFASVSLGYRARLDGTWPAQPALCADATSSSCLLDHPLRDEVTFAFAMRGPVEAALAGIFLLVKPSLAGAAVLSGAYASTYLTVVGSIDARDPFRAANTPVELGTGLQSVFGEWTLAAGAAFGVTPAPGVSAVRGVFSLQWAPRFIDDDHDGLRDDPAIDHCIGLREDFDGYQDDDVCPEDNDHDAIPDEDDRCPFVDEDEDGFEDEDGCPDPDNDGDGVLDVDDRCRDEAAGPHPDPQRPGCPLPAARAATPGAPPASSTPAPAAPATNPAPVAPPPVAAQPVR